MRATERRVRPSLQAARYIVLAIVVICYAGVGLFLISGRDDYLWGMSILGAIGTVYLGLYLYASISTNESAASLLASFLPLWF